MSLRKSSRRRNGSKSDVLPKPNARRRCTPAPSSVGLDLISRLTGRIDMIASSAVGHPSKLRRFGGRADLWSGLRCPPAHMTRSQNSTALEFADPASLNHHALAILHAVAAVRMPQGDA